MKGIDSEYPKVLIISHNLFDITNNVGKTLVSLFEGWPKDKIAQIYFRNDSPSFKYCKEYYCITDKEVIQSVLTLRIKSAGKEVNNESVQNISEAEQHMYRIGNHRRPFICFIRDLIWQVAKWRTAELKIWLKRVNPDIILFVPDNYCLAYRFALWVKEICPIPIIPFHMDDTFYYGRKTSFIDLHRRKTIFSLAKRLEKNSNIIFTICNAMSKEYEELLGIPCQDFMNSVKIDKNKISNIAQSNKVIFSYFGNLHNNRWKSLAEIAEALQNLDIRDKHIELRVFSRSKLDPKMKRMFGKKKIIKYMGDVPEADLERWRADSDILIYVEAFDRQSINSLRLSLSTKIPEYLASGICIFAYASEEFASTQYIKDNYIGFVCTKKEELNNKLLDAIYNRELRQRYAQKGLIIASKNHNIISESCVFQKKIIEQAMGECNDKKSCFH